MKPNKSMLREKFPPVKLEDGDTITVTWNFTWDEDCKYFDKVFGICNQASCKDRSRGCPVKDSSQWNA
jgi:hypothetical protein